VPVYPSYPPVNIDGSEGGPMADAASRFAHIAALAARGLLDFAVIDPGSVNLSQTKTTAAAKPAGTYMNPEAQVRHALDFAARHKLHPAFAIYEAGFARAGAALARAAGTKAPIYRLMFCEGLAVGFPPRPYALSAYLALLEEEARGAPWMIAAVNADLRPLFAETIARRPRPRWPRGCAAGNDHDQSRAGRGGRAAGAPARRGAGRARRDAAGASAIRLNQNAEVPCNLIRHAENRPTV
jgi:beta-keto acid cleavage enzyme